MRKARMRDDGDNCEADPISPRHRRSRVLGLHGQRQRTDSMMKKRLGEALWREKEKLALAWLEAALEGKPERLTSDAWLGVGVKIK